MSDVSSQVVRIGNGCGFWGDSVDAPLRLIQQQPDLDYLTLDYLAEVSMSILARMRERDPTGGFAPDFVDVIRSLAEAGVWRTSPNLRVVSNGGGLNPRGCAEACREILEETGNCDLRIGVVTGDDILAKINETATEGSPNPDFQNLETGESIETILDRIVTANAYLGAEPVVETLRGNAQIVITGRVADPSLTVAACAHRFGWPLDDFDSLASATVAGHLIECGAQVAGGISTDWLNVPDASDMGYPVIEMVEDATFVVTKPAGSGGRVNERTVKEQLLYEIGDPDRYLSPDATVSFLGLRLEVCGVDRVRVVGARGRPPPSTFKVSATFRAGYQASGQLTISGPEAEEKGRRCGNIVRERLRRHGCEPQQWLAECLGAGDVAPMNKSSTTPREVVLRMTAADERRSVVERFAREFMPLITTGPQGVTGYAAGRPRAQEVFGYWPCLIDRERVNPRVEFLEV